MERLRRRARAAWWRARRAAPALRTRRAWASPGTRGEVLGRRRGNGVQHLLHDILRANALNPQLRPEHQAMRERGHGDGLHVLRRDEVAAAEQRLGAAQL